MSVRYLLIFVLFFSNLISRSSSEGESERFTTSENTEKASAAQNFQKFLLSKYEVKATRTEGEDDRDENSNWENLQHQRMEAVVDGVNSMFEPLQDYFNYKLLTGYHAGDVTYHVGSFARHISNILQTLPDIAMLPKLTWLWRLILSGKREKNGGTVQLL